MPRPKNSNSMEKAKDFKGTWLKIIRYCKKYYGVLILAMICADLPLSAYFFSLSMR